MKIYLAGPYGRRLELCGYRDQLHAMGHEVTSRWLQGNARSFVPGVRCDVDAEALVEGPGDDPTAVLLRERFAQEDLADVLACDCMFNFTEPPDSDASRGGRHVEFGVAMGIAMSIPGRAKRLIVVGYRENIFHWLPGVEFAADFEAAVTMIKPPIGPSPVVTWTPADGKTPVGEQEEVGNRQ